MFTINGKNITLGKKITFIAARNGFGKTLISRKIEEGINKKMKVATTIPLTSFDFTASNKKAIYFSLDDLQAKGLQMDFSFLDKVYNEQKKKFGAIKLEAKKILGSSYEEDTLKSILKFREKITEGRWIVSFRDLFSIEQKAISHYQKYGDEAVPTIMRFLIDQGFTVKTPRYSNPEWGRVNFPYNKYLYLCSPHFDEYYNELNFVDTSSVNAQLYNELKSEASGADYNASLCGMAVYISFVSEVYDVIKILNDGRFIRELNTDLLEKETINKNEMLTDAMTENWIKFGLPNDLSVSAKGKKINISRDISTLSKSEKYRISFNALYSLLKEVKESNLVLILDDPFDSLDEENHTALIPAIVELSKEMEQIIIATHKLEIPEKFSRYINIKNMESYVATKGDVFHIDNFKALKLREVTKMDFSSKYLNGHNLAQRLYFEKTDNVEMKNVYEKAMYSKTNIVRDMEPITSANRMQLEMMRRLDKVALFKIKKSLMIDKIYAIKNGKATYNTGTPINKKSLKTIINQNNTNAMPHMFEHDLLPQEVEEFMNDFYYKRTLINNFSHSNEMISLLNILFLDEEKLDELTLNLTFSEKSIDNPIKSMSAEIFNPEEIEVPFSQAIIVSSPSDESPFEGEFEGDNFNSDDDE